MFVVVVFFFFFFFLFFFFSKIEYDFKMTSEVTKNQSGRTQMMTFGESIRQTWVNVRRTHKHEFNDNPKAGLGMFQSFVLLF